MTDRPPDPSTAQPVPWADRLRSEKYVMLTTFRRNGQAVGTPVWFALKKDRILVFTGAQTGKAKRIVRNPAVTIAPCSLRGRITGPVWPATACILPDDEGARVMRLIVAKYPVTKRLLALVVGTIRLVRRRPQTHSVYIEITAS